MYVLSVSMFIYERSAQIFIHQHVKKEFPFDIHLIVIRFSAIDHLYRHMS